jgi:isoquinoline 1-oxidoreductase beta subunit
MFRPQTYQCLEAALDKDGKVAGWRHCVVGDGGSLTYSGIKLESYYGIPNQDILQRGPSHGIRLKHWRAVAHPFNLFAIEGLVDEMAAKEGQDPFAFRRERLAMPEKAQRVFDMVEKMSDWKAKRPEGRALGLSVSERSARSAPAWSRSRSTASRARSTSTRCGRQSTAAPSCSRRWRAATSRAASSTASRAC